MDSNPSALPRPRAFPAEWSRFNISFPLFVFQSIWKTGSDRCKVFLKLCRTTWNSGNISSGFQRHSGQPYSYLVEAYVLHVPWDLPLVLHLPTSWWLAWKPSSSLSQTCEQALVGLKMGSIMIQLPHSVRPGRRSTGSAKNAKFFFVLFCGFFFFVWFFFLIFKSAKFKIPKNLHKLAQLCWDRESS